MRIGFDATALLTPRTGVGVMAHEVLSGLADRGDVDLTAFCVSVRGRSLLGGVSPPGARVVAPPLPARPLRALWGRIDAPRVDWLLGQPDVIHGPNFVVPAARAARVATVHDLTPVRFPHLADPHTRGYARQIARLAEDGGWVHTPSAAVLDEVIEELGVTPSRVRAIPNGVRPVGGSPAAGRRRAGAERYVLAVGTVEPRKGLPTLLAAFDALAGDHPEVDLVHAGADGWGLAEYEAALAAMANPTRVRRLGRVDDAARADLLAGCAVFAYPSLYEGFGLPPLEAMTAGVPVVTTDVPAIGEVCAGHARIVPVGDTEALAGALEQVLEQPPGPGELAAARRHASTFRWEDTVESLVDLYRTAAAQR